MKYSFAVAVHIEAEANFKEGKSKLLKSDVQLFADPGIEKDWRGKDGVVNKEGMKVQTQGLVQGLIANIHWAHQNGYWDSAAHLRYIIENLENGFQQSNTKATTGKF